VDFIELLGRGADVGDEEDLRFVIGCFLGGVEVFVVGRVDDEDGIFVVHEDVGGDMEEVGAEGEEVGGGEGVGLLDGEEEFYRRGEEAFQVVGIDIHKDNLYCVGTQDYKTPIQVQILKAQTMPGMGYVDTIDQLHQGIGID
jgi:hypothetical protein